MSRTVALAATFTLLGAGGALAADCGTTTESNFGNEGSIFFDTAPTLSGTDSLTCPVSNALAVPGGHYGVFRTYTGGFVDLQDGASATYSVTAFGKTSSTTFSGPKTDSTVATGTFATGYVAVDTSFDGDVTIATEDADSAELNAVDLVVGYTTLDNAEGSLDAVARQQAGLLTHLDLTAGLLTGFGKPTEGADEWSVFGALGSYNAGGTLHYNLAPGLSLLAGGSLVSLDAAGAGAFGGLGAVALRYVAPSASGFRPVVEGGLEAGALGLSFSRTYDNGTVSDYAASTSGMGLLGGAWVRGGVLVDVDSANQLLFSASLKQSGFYFTNLAETDPADSPNLFLADYSGKTAHATTIKAGVDWTTALAADLDLTTSVAAGTTLGSAATASIFGIGNVTGASASTLFVEYGARLGWQRDAGTTIDGFIQGTSGTGIGTHVQAGAGYRVKF